MVGIIVLLILVVLAVVVFHSSSNPPTTSLGTAQTSPQTATTSTTSSAASYTAANDGFGVDFPGTPEVTESTFNSPSAGSIPLTEYRVTAATTPLPQYYTVYVYHYPSSYTFSSDYLSVALQAYVEAVSAQYKGSTLATQAQVQFSGAPALTASITIPVENQSTQDYVLLTTHDHNQYIMSTYGVPESDFTAFTNSFAFSQ